MTGITGKEETITQAELALAIRNMGWSHPEGRARRLFDKVLSSEPEEKTGLGLFRVTVRRIDGNVHSGREHSTEVPAGNWLAAVKEAGGSGASWTYAVKEQTP